MFLSVSISARVHLKGKLRKRNVLNLPRVSCRLRSESGRTGTAAGKNSEHEEKADNFVAEGRRIGGVGLLCEQLTKGCLLRRRPLRLPSLFGELRYGLASRFDVRCEGADCLAVNHPFTSKQRRGLATRGPKAFDVNTKIGTW